MRMPGLDLLRALAVIWVMLFHSFVVGGLGEDWAWLSRYGWTGVDLGAAGYMVVKVNRVVPRQAPDAQRAQQERQQYEQWLTTAEGLAYYELLKQRFKVQIKAPRPIGQIEPQN